MGLSNHQVADLIGITYQQLHKYENGTNRVSAGRLYAIAVALDADVASFFEHIESVPARVELQEPSSRLIEFTRNVLRITGPECMHALCEMTRAMAKSAQGNPGGRGAPIVRSPSETTQTLSDLDISKGRVAPPSSQGIATHPVRYLEALPTSRLAQEGNHPCLSNVAPTATAGSSISRSKAAHRSAAPSTATSYDRNWVMAV